MSLSKQHYLRDWSILSFLTSLLFSASLSLSNPLPNTLSLTHIHYISLSLQMTMKMLKLFTGDLSSACFTWHDIILHTHIYYSFGLLHPFFTSLSYFSNFFLLSYSSFPPHEPSFTPQCTPLIPHTTLLPPSFILYPPSHLHPPSCIPLGLSSKPSLVAVDWWD